jgi:hypothetical protein
MESEKTTAYYILRVCNDIRDVLLAKNRSYGDSAANPVRVFSKASPEEAMLVRIDDKLSRIMRGSEFPGDDTITDLIGYLILLKATREKAKEASLDTDNCECSEKGPCYDHR